MTADPNQAGWPTLFAAFAIALVSSLSVLFVGEVMGQVPCNLCWFQRAFMFPLTVVLGIAALRADTGAWLYGIALAKCGWLIAGFHTLLYAGIVPERIQPCTAGGPSCSGSDMTVLGVVPLPGLSLLAFSAIIVLLFFSRRRPAP
ncbi:disulfide bond formation protein B [Aquibium microcysteis]|uniref:disulfide bond formation protein B n=1 Tax=Aquibium microcysteis TaxID=675281 RepID=UPI00165D1F70|nr:disulfide bond formation protein B [Aquibium microcysteis]